MALSMSAPALGKDWNGLTPLHSTLADVVRKFGPCDSKSKTLCVYSWTTETVTFVFLSNSCGTGKQRLPRGTIVRIERRPKTPTRLPDYHKIDPYHYSAFSPKEDPNEYIENYVDESEGFAAEAREGAVTLVFYTGRSQEITGCSTSYVKPANLLPRYEGAVVWEFFCPTITVSCVDKTIEVDEVITFAASYAGGFPYWEPTLTWVASTGFIIEGQGTPTIRVATKGLANGTEVMATLTMGGIPAGCLNQASCTTRIYPYLVRTRN
jgi:hypothetical protein